MGTIYKALDTRDGKDVAVKVLHSEFTKDDEDVKRFIRAMTTAVELKHPNIIRLYAAGKSAGSCWFAMEYVDGDPLTRLIENLGILNRGHGVIVVKVMFLNQQSPPRS